MVAEAKDTMNKMFESMDTSSRSAFDAGRRFQEAWFKSARDAWMQPTEFERVANRGDQMLREWIPLVERGFETVSQTVDANFRAGLDLFRKLYNVGFKSEETDVYRKSRQAWDAAFDTMRTTLDSYAKASTRLMDDYTSACQRLCACDSNGKAAGKGGKSA